MSQETELYQAAKRGDLDEIRRLVAAGADLDKPAGAGFHPPIVIAAEGGQLMAVELLLELGATPDAVGKHNVTALAKAIQCGKTAVIELLLTLPCYSTDRARRQALHDAIYYKRTALIERLLKEHAFPVNDPLFPDGTADKNEAGWTPLHYAAMHQKCESARTLIRAGADPMVRDKRGRTPLHVDGYDGELAALLLAAGTDRNVKDAKGKRPGILTDRFWNEHVEQALPAALTWIEKMRAADAGSASGKKAGKGNGPQTAPGSPAGRSPRAAKPKPGVNPEAQLHLEEAARCGAIAALRTAIENGADPKSKVGRGRTTALHLAAENNHVAAIDYLLQAGCLIDTTDSGGRTPLYKAVERGYLEAVDFLLSRGASVSQPESSKGWTPLHAAAVCGKPEVVERLLRAGADPNPGDSSGARPLNAAVGQLTDMPVRAIEAAEILVRSGADPTAANGHLESPAEAIRTRMTYYRDPALKRLLDLMTDTVAPRDADGPSREVVSDCITGAKVEELREMLNQGLIPDSRSADGQTLLHFACASGQVEIAELLLDHQASLEAVDPAGYTALHHAAENGSTKLIKLLVTRGAKINAPVRPVEQDADGPSLTPLHLAVAESRLPAIRLLLKMGADVDAIGGDTMSPLALSLFQGGFGTRNPVPVARLLLSHGASPTTKTENGSPLQIVREQVSYDLPKGKKASQLSMDEALDLLEKRWKR